MSYQVLACVFVSAIQHVNHIGKSQRRRGLTIGTFYILQNVPVSFVISHMEQDRQSATLVVSVKSWPVGFSRGRGHVRMMTHGWPIFSRENALKVGDVCVFELVDRTDFVLKVSVFRCLD